MSLRAKIEATLNAASDSDWIGFDEDGALAARWVFTGPPEWKLEPDRNVLLDRLQTIFRQSCQFSVGTEPAPDGDGSALILTYLPQPLSEGSLAEFRTACAAIEAEYAAAMLGLERLKPIGLPLRRARSNAT
jgi:hypothetical protein